MVLVLVALAQEAAADPSTDPVAALIGGAGVAGVWIVTILLGQMHSNSAMKREQARADKAEARVDQLTDVYTREILPALNNATTAMRVIGDRDGTS